MNFYKILTLITVLSISSCAVVVPKAQTVKGERPVGMIGKNNVNAIAARECKEKILKSQKYTNIFYEAFIKDDVYKETELMKQVLPEASKHAVKKVVEQYLDGVASDIGNANYFAMIYRPYKFKTYDSNSKILTLKSNAKLDDYHYNYTERNNKFKRKYMRISVDISNSNIFHKGKNGFGTKIKPLEAFELINSDESYWVRYYSENPECKIELAGLTVTRKPEFIINLTYRPIMIEILNEKKEIIKEFK